MSPFVHTFTLWITCGQLWISTASLVPENRKLVCDIYGFTTIIITNQHKTYRHPPNTHHTHTSYSPPANCLLTRQPATQATNQATKTASQASQPTRASSIASQQVGTGLVAYSGAGISGIASPKLPALTALPLVALVSSQQGQPVPLISKTLGQK